MDKRDKILTIGDGMITMNPVTSGPLRFVNQFERKVGGAELNFAIGISRLGLASKWISRLGNDEFGKYVYNFARGEGIDMDEVSLLDDYTTPLNFKEIRADGSGKTFYYRGNSPILTISSDQISEQLFEGISVLHISGVYLSLDKTNVEIVLKMMQIAKENGVLVSFDPNIRLKIWSIEEAREAYHQIFPYVDILLTGRDEIELIENISLETDLEIFAEKYRLKDLVIKDGKNGSKLYRNGIWTKRKAFSVKAIDTVGAGDGFDAGYIYGYLNNFQSEHLLDFSNGVGALVTTVSGDNDGLPYLDEVNALIHNEFVIER